MTAQLERSQTDSFIAPDAGLELAYCQSSAIVTSAMAELEQGQNGEQMWPEAALLTTNQQIRDRQIQVVEQTDTAEAGYHFYLKLHNWVDLYHKSTYDDQPFQFAQRRGERSGTLHGLQSRRFDTPNATTRLIHGKSVLSTDGLVEISILKNDQSAAELAEQLDSALIALTGEPLWEDARQHDSFLSQKIDSYRSYHKLPEGPLTADQIAAAGQLEFVQTSASHISLVAHGQSKHYRLERQPGERITPRHEVMRLDDSIQAIVDGRLTSGLQRKQRGGPNGGGRSSESDMYTGGGDVVYTYASTANQIATRHLSAAAQFVLRPESLDRVDVRAYVDDAHGSREDSRTAGIIDLAISRDEKHPNIFGVEYASRIAPEGFWDLAGVHELDFEGGVGIGECSALYVSSDDRGSYEDTRWPSLLVPYADRTRPDMIGDQVHRMAERLKSVWGDSDAVSQYLQTIGLPQDKINYLVAGMNLPIRERVVAKLAVLNITQINGRPANEFVHNSTS